MTKKIVICCKTDSFLVSRILIRQYRCNTIYTFFFLGELHNKHQAFNSTYPSIFKKNLLSKN